MFRNSLKENLTHLKFLSQEELQIAPSPLCPQQKCENSKNKIENICSTMQGTKGKKFCWLINGRLLVFFGSGVGGPLQDF